MPGKNYNRRPEQSYLNRKPGAMTPCWSVTLANMLPSNAMQHIFAAVIMSTVAFAPSLYAQTLSIELILAERLLVQPNKRSAIAIQIEPSEQLPSDAFDRMRGLPPTATLTQGYRVNKSGTWAVPVKSLMKLRVQSPREIAEPIPVQVQLTSLAGQIIAERKTTLIMGPRPLAPPQLASQAQKSASKACQRAADVIAATSTLAVGDTKPTTDGTQTAATSSSEPITAPAEETPAQRLLKRGHSFLLDGNISIARQFYQRSAKLGLATAAIAMASTYDPAELPKMGLVDLPGSSKLAREWYEKAKEMGSPVADERLKRLPSN